MNDLQKEINELKEFIAYLKADRVAAKEKEQREAWTKYVSLTIVIVAVITAMATQLAGKYSSRTQMSQIKASDQWSFYEAKSIKQHLDEATMAQLGNHTNDPATAAFAKKMAANLARYDQEKSDIMDKAKALEAKRDDASLRSGMMATALSLFSVSIATASICTVTKKKPLWFISMLMALIAVAQMIHAVLVK